jgi:hypothetical protein
MIAHIPLMLVPFALYNLGLFGIFGSGSNPWSTEILSVTMMSGGVFAMGWGDLLVLVALLILFVEVLKSTRTSNASVLDHLLSTLVLIAFIVEFLLVREAATSLFFTLMLIALIDVMAGFSVSLRASSRDVNFR